MRRLVFKPGLKIAFIHPDFIVVIFGIGIFSELPVNSPPAVGTIYNINHAFLLAGMIPVMIDRYQVPVFVKRKLMGISESRCEDFKIASVGIRTQNSSLVRVGPLPAVSSFHVKTDIAYAPVDSPVGPHR